MVTFPDANTFSFTPDFSISADIAASEDADRAHHNPAAWDNDAVGSEAGDTFNGAKSDDTGGT